MTCRTSRRGIGHPSQGPRLVPTCMKNLLRRARRGVSCRRRPKRWVRRNLGNRWESQTKASAVVRFLRELPTFHRLASHRKERIYICRASSFSLGIRFKKSYRNFRSYMGGRRREFLNCQTKNKKYYFLLISFLIRFSYFLIQPRRMHIYIFTPSKEKKKNI